MFPWSRLEAPDRWVGPSRRRLGLGAVCLAAWWVACGPVGDDFKIAGHVRLRDGAPLEGVQVVVTWPAAPDAHKELITDEEGWYSWRWYAGWVEGTGLRRVVVTPEDPGYSFEPEAYDIKLYGDRTDLDFVATPRGAERSGGPVWLWLVLTGPGPATHPATLEGRGLGWGAGVRARLIDLRRAESGQDGPGH